MAGYKNFAIVGAGTLGNYVIRQFLKDKAAGTVNEVVVLTRQVSYRPVNLCARCRISNDVWTGLQEHCRGRRQSDLGRLFQPGIHQERPGWRGGRDQYDFWSSPRRSGENR